MNDNCSTRIGYDETLQSSCAHHLPHTGGDAGLALAAGAVLVAMGLFLRRTVAR